MRNVTNDLVINITVASQTFVHRYLKTYFYLIGKKCLHGA